MPRPNFECSAQHPYHVTTRCINKEWFDCPLQDVWESLTTHLLCAHHAFRLQVHALVLMSNHFHLLVSAPEANLSEAMAFILRETSRDIRHSSDRINQTFAERFRRTRLESEAYFRNTYRYIYQNPIRAGLASRVENYPFSSLRWLLGLNAMKVPVSDHLLLADSEEILAWLNRRLINQDCEAIRTALSRVAFQLPKTKSKRLYEVEDFLKPFDALPSQSTPRSF